MSDVSSDEKSRKFLSITEAAEILGLSRMTLYRVIAAGEFPTVRVGRRLFVPGQALDDLVAAAIACGGVVDAAEWRRTEVAG
ncbi:helix-turn-helix domain-containing protein [Kribbella sp. NPDC049174]|uniref:helix-turn-helix domain-containing protein n=1 Tax=Kribbella sp. NPDC049174 TaxID=3364112 RepID=UPI00372177E2